MKFIGFNFTKIRAERNSDHLGELVLNSNIDFADLTEGIIELLKDEKTFKLTFKFSFIYEPKENKKEKIAEISLEGQLIISATKEESKDLLDSWKKKTLPEKMSISIVNQIMKRCTMRSISLQDELNLPSPFLNIPKATTKID